MVSGFGESLLKRAKFMHKSTERVSEVGSCRFRTFLKGHHRETKPIQTMVTAKNDSKCDIPNEEDCR